MVRFVLFGWSILAAVTSSANGAVFYDFDDPPYLATGINGQEGWTAGLGASVVVVSAPDQALLISANDSATNTLAGSGFGNITSLSYLAAVSSGLAYAEVQLKDSASTLYAHVGFQNSPDAFYYYDDGGIQSTSSAVASDNVYLVDLTLNFDTQQYRVTFTDTTDSSLDFDSGFVNLIASTSSAQAEAGEISLFGGVEGQSAFFDDISVSAVPEPAGLVLGGISLCVLLGVDRRRKRRI